MKHFFYKGKENLLTGKQDLSEVLEFSKKEFSKVLESKNISFLMGSGCSLGSGGIPTMVELAKNFFNPVKEINEGMSEKLQELVLTDEQKETLLKLNIDISKEPFVSNIETFLGTLYSYKFYLDQIQDEPAIKEINEIIIQAKKFILYQCLNEDNIGNDSRISDNYRDFYRRLSLRDSNLPKPNVFTTNYDLYSEKAMDDLGIHYTNGFSGFIERYFNPAIFNYALAEQMDISSFKWNVIDSFIYFFKIHGSVNWIEKQEGNKLFKIRELQNVSYNTLELEENLMIYPSPIKQNASLGSPYTDLFREFQKRIAQNQSVLVTMGFSFGDEHINNLIYQALTIPTFRLVIFSDLEYYSGDGKVIARENIKRLKDLNDPRIWIIGSNKEYRIPPIVEEEETSEEEIISGEENPFKIEKTQQNIWEEINPSSGLFYFSTIVNELLPDWSENKIEDQNEKIIQLMSTNINKPSES
jgi:hypothetical protein